MFGNGQAAARDARLTEVAVTGTPCNRICRAKPQTVSRREYFLHYAFRTLPPAVADSELIPFLLYLHHRGPGNSLLLS